MLRLEMGYEDARSEEWLDWVLTATNCVERQICIWREDWAVRLQTTELCETVRALILTGRTLGEARAFIEYDDFGDFESLTSALRSGLPIDFAIEANAGVRS